MSSRSADLRTWLRKEFRSELRSRHALLVSGLFGLMAVAAASFGGSIEKPTPTLAAGLLTVILLFAGSISVPRMFLSEDEQGTFDLTRTIGPLGDVFLAKLVFSLCQQTVTSVVLGFLFVGMVGMTVENLWLFLVAMVGLGVALASALSLSTACILGAANRWILAVAVAMPLLFPLVFLGMGCLRVAFGDGAIAAGWTNAAALVGYSVVPFSAGPWLVEQIWSDQMDPLEADLTNQNQEQG